MRLTCAASFTSLWFEWPTQGLETGPDSFPCLKRVPLTSSKVTLSWPGSGMFFFLPAVAISLFIEYLTFQWTSDLESIRVQVGEGIRIKTVLLPCAWHLTWEINISPRNDCEYLISPENAIYHNSQKSEEW